MKLRLIVCLDDKNGMAFNHRRQSRDCIVTAKIAELVKGSTLHFSPLFLQVISFWRLRAE